MSAMKKDWVAYCKETFQWSTVSHKLSWKIYSQDSNQ